MNQLYYQRPYKRVRINDKPEIIGQSYGSQRRSLSGIATPALCTKNTSQKYSNKNEKAAPHSSFLQSSTRLRSSDSRQKSSLNKLEEVNRLNHRNFIYEKTVSNLEYLPHRFKVNKDPISLEYKIRDLTQENDYLRQELIKYKNINQTLFKSKMFDIICTTFYEPLIN